MKIETFDKVATVSAKLNGYLKQLKDCELEKQKILEAIEDLQSKGKLEKNSKLIEVDMQHNLKKYKSIVENIERLKKVVD